MLGTQTQFGIGISISLQDRFSNTADRVERRLRNLKNHSRTTIQAAARDYRNHATNIAAGAAAVTYGFYRAAQQAGEFGHKINLIDIVGQGKLGKTKKQLADLALDLSNQFGTSAKDISDAMLENTRAGVNKGLAEITRYQLGVSVATGETVQSVSEHLLGMVNAYNLPMTAFARVANATTAVANASMASVASIGESMQYAAFTAKTFNIPLEQTLALVGKLSQSRIYGSAAGTALNNMMLYLGTSLSSSATPKHIQTWKALGLDRGQMRGLMDSGKIFEVVSAIDTALQGIGPSDKLKIIKDLTNMRGARGLLGSWGSTDSDKSLDSLLKAGQQGVASDIVTHQSKKAMEDPYMQGKKAIEAFNNALIKFIGQAGPMISQVAKGLAAFGNVLGKIAATPIGSIFGLMVGVAAPLVAIFYGLRAAALGAAQALASMSLTRTGAGGFSTLLAGTLGSNLRTRAASSASAGLFKKNAAGNWVPTRPVWYQGKMYQTGSMMPGGRNFNPAKGGWSSGLYSAVAKNSAGRYYVKAGQAFNLGGRVYNSGNLLPASFTPRTITPTMASRVYGAAAGRGLAGGLLPVLGRIAGWVSGIGMLTMVGMSIYELLKADNGDKPGDQSLYRDDPWSTAAFAGLPKADMEAAYAERAAQKDSLFQQITVNVDGRPAFNELIKQNTVDGLQKQLNFNLTQ